MPPRPRTSRRPRGPAKSETSNGRHPADNRGAGWVSSAHDAGGRCAVGAGGGHLGRRGVAGGPGGPCPAGPASRARRPHGGGLAVPRGRRNSRSAERRPGRVAPGCRAGRNEAPHPRRRSGRAGQGGFLPVGGGEPPPTGLPAIGGRCCGGRAEDGPVAGAVAPGLSRRAACGPIPDASGLCESARPACLSAPMAAERACPTPLVRPAGMGRSAPGRAGHFYGIPIS